jgi:hypothetical protein
MASRLQAVRGGDEVGQLSKSLARVNAICFATVFGAVAGVGLWLATMFLVIKGGPSPGHTMAVLGYAFPGYSVSFGGAFVSLLWAFVTAFLISLPSAWIYYRGVLQHIEYLGVRANDAATTRAVRIHLPYFAVAFGLLCGFTLLLSTLFLILKHRPGEPLGPHLGLLSQYLPGYSITVGGSLLGFAYSLVIGSVVFASVAWIYNRLVSLYGSADEPASFSQHALALDD